MSTTGHETEAINVQGLKASLKKGGNKGIYNEAICSTAGATAAKVTNTTPPSFSLVSGAKIIVKFTYGITVDNATLQVGSAAAKPIYFRGSALEADIVKAGTSLLLSYDGTAFNIIGGLGENLEAGDGIDITNNEVSVKAGVNLSFDENGNLNATDTTYSTMGASGSSHAGGLVPDTPSTAGTTKFLREDGTWQEPESGGSSYTPTLSSAPTESTLTYTKDGQTVAFEIGQFCRVADANAPLGYKFFQLYDIANNGTVAKWNEYLSKTAPIYTAPTAKSLTYTGSNQYLLNAGSTSDGTIQYSIDGGTTWTTTVPTSKNAGSYAPQWRLIGDESHTDIPAQTINVTIAKANRTLSFTTAPTTLNVGASVTVAATPSAGSGDGTITYSSGDTSKATVSGSTVTGVSEGTVTITATISGGTNYNDATTSYSLVVSSIAVDMGLPSGVKWAKYNLDLTTTDKFAASEFQYECSYFSWGNTDGHTPSSDGTFDGNFGKNTAYTSTAGAALTGNIPLSHDAARVNLGGSWRMPTKDEFEELFNNIDFLQANGTTVIPSSTTNKLVTVNGVVGVYLKSKINGNKLFFPCCGYAKDGSLNHKSTNSYQWSSTYIDSTTAYGTRFRDTEMVTSYTSFRYYGFAVRPVI